MTRDESAMPDAELEAIRSQSDALRHTYFESDEQHDPAVKANSWVDVCQLLSSNYALLAEIDRLKAEIAAQEGWDR